VNSRGQVYEWLGQQGPPKHAARSPNMLKMKVENRLGGPQRCYIKTLLKGCGLHNEVLQATTLEDDRSKIIHSCIRHQRQKEGETPHIKPFPHGRY
jgi:hypothetical protein